MTYTCWCLVFLHILANHPSTNFWKLRAPQTRPSWDSPKPGPKDADSLYLATGILGPRPRGRPPMVLDRRWWIPSFYPNKVGIGNNNQFFFWVGNQNNELKSRKKLWLPSRERIYTYPTYWKGKSSTQKCRLGKGYVSSRESNSFRTFRVWESCR